MAQREEQAQQDASSMDTYVARPLDRLLTMTDTPTGLRVVIGHGRTLGGVASVLAHMALFCATSCILAHMLSRRTRFWGSGTWGDVMAVMACVGIIGNLLNALSLMSSLAGRWVLVIDGSSLRVSRRLFGLGIWRNYPLHEVRNLRFWEQTDVPWYHFMAKMPYEVAPHEWDDYVSRHDRTALEFDCQGKAKRFAIGIRRDAAEALIKQVNRRGWIQASP